MSFEIIYTPDFEKQLKKLAKKYHSLADDFADLITQLELNPIQGQPLGKSCYKIRLSISSKNKGKSGGARVITHLFIDAETIFLLSIYDKSEKDSITDAELNDLLKRLK